MARVKRKKTAALINSKQPHFQLFVPLLLIPESYLIIEPFESKSIVNKKYCICLQKIQCSPYLLFGVLLVAWKKMKAQLLA